MEKLCFFTMANKKRLGWAQRLISSGDVVGRPIWFYRIPDSHPDPKRYKIELLMGDLLPEAEKYVYLDSDTFMLQYGDWESSECVGAALENFRQDYRQGFSDEKGHEAFCKLYKEYEAPERVNTGCVVLPSDIRKQVAQRWMEWCHKIDAFCEKPSKTRDQMHFAFVRKEFGLPILPSRFNALIKREEVLPDHILIHAAGKPHGDDVKSYHDAVNRVLGGYLWSIPQTEMGYRWQVITYLILLYAENPTFPVIAEIGVDVGETANHLLRSFPGLKLYAVDNWCRGLKRYDAWCKVRGQYDDHIVELKCLSDEPVLEEFLDLVFIDANHTTEQTVRDIEHWLPQVKNGGVIVGHDIDHKSKTGSVSSVRRAVEVVFGSNFKTGPDYTWWTVKK